MSGPDALSLNEQAALGEVRPRERSQFAHLVTHYLERFFNHETAAPDGSAKARLVLAAFAAGLPGFVVALYLWPIYHPFKGWPLDHPSHGEPPPYWLQVNHHFFFVVYSFVVMGIAAVFEWDLFFPDLLDIFVLGTLPVPDRRLFLARVSAIAIFVAGFLFTANFLAPLMLAASTEPRDGTRLIAGDVLAAFGAGLFAALFVIAFQSALLALLGERFFRRLSLLVQGLSISALLMLLLLFPVLSGAVPALLRSGSMYARWFPPFWFLGVYQRVLEGPSALPIYTQLAQTAWMATLAAAAVALIAYPLAYLRRVHRLVEGTITRRSRNLLARVVHPLIHLSLARSPMRRAVIHFIGQTLLRVPRYRIYLVLYGGVGLSVVVASILRLTVVHNLVHVQVSADGLRAAIAIIAFWIVAGLRAAFVSPGNQQGSWVFRVVNGNPPSFARALDRLRAAKTWVCAWAFLVTFAVLWASRAIAPRELLTASATAAQALVAASLCLLLTDVFFLHVTTVPFTGAPAGEDNLAFTLLKYFTFFPLVLAIPVITEPWIERSLWRLAAAAFAVIAMHIALRLRHRALVGMYCREPAVEDGEESYFLRLGLLS